MKCAGHCEVCSALECALKCAVQWRVLASVAVGAVQRESQPHRPLLHRHPCRAPRTSCTLLRKIDSQTFLCAASPSSSSSSCLLHPQADCCTNDELQWQWRGSPPMLLLPLWRNNSVGSSNPGKQGPVQLQLKYFGVTLQLQLVCSLNPLQQPRG